ncbi:MAG: 4Fe-4S binding protein [Bacteroidales bacterium]
MKVKGKQRINHPRLIIQWTTLLLLGYLVVRPLVDKNYISDFEAYCPFGGLQSLSAFLVKNVLACSMTTVQISLGIVLIAGAILAGKLFCSYICPIGTFTEWLGRLGEKYKLRFTITGIADKLLRSIKYILLGLTFYFTITSGELFCKKFDPYYATFSGFSSDVVVLYAILALVITIAGSFFIRQFWCRYICPLGAITNIFIHLIPFASVTLLYVLLNLTILPGLSWIWYLLAITITGILTEIVISKSYGLPLLKITRTDDKCTQCHICDKVCPMAIDISGVDKVTHHDCHLCGDCLAMCPEEGALLINNRNWKWLPMVVIVILIAIAMYISGVVEIPTINERWGDKESFKTAKEFKMSGLQSIKCFGSSSSFATQMKSVPGVLGVETFVKHHSVKVFYDPAKISPEGIKEAIFTPVSSMLNYPGSSIKNIAQIDMGINNFFDTSDEYFLAGKLSREKGIMGMATSFGEPVRTSVFYDPSKITPERIRQLVEEIEETSLPGKANEKKDVHFSVAYSKGAEIIPVMEFLKLMYEPVDEVFNGFDSIAATDLAIYQLPFPQAIKPELQEWIPYLLSHSSNDNGIVRFQTMFSDSIPELRIWYVKKLTIPSSILQLLNKPQLKVYYPDGTKKTFNNLFSFEGPGEIIRVK